MYLLCKCCRNLPWLPVWPSFLFEISEYIPEIPEEKFLHYVIWKYLSVNNAKITLGNYGMKTEFLNKKEDKQETLKSTTKIIAWKKLYSKIGPVLLTHHVLINKSNYTFSIIKYISILHLNIQIKNFSVVTAYKFLVRWEKMNALQRLKNIQIIIHNMIHCALISDIDRRLK